MDSLSFNDIVANKLQSSYPDFIVDNINLVSINKNNSIPIGTMSYAYTIYPSDIDVFETVDRGNTADNVIAFFEKSIQNLVSKISKIPNYWIIEVKCGIDERYRFDVNDKDAEVRTAFLLNKGLLTEEEADVVLHSDEEIANDLLRKKYTLRWSPEEILHGEKQLPGGDRITLNQALHSKSQINIEIIGLINDRFMDLSNFYVLMYKDRQGIEHAINLPEETVTNFSRFFVNNLKKNMTKLFYSKVGQDYYKVIKRFWSFGKFVHDESLIDRILPFVNSIVALAGQKRSELKTLINLVKHTKLQGVPTNVFYNQLSNIKLSIAGIVGLGAATISHINAAIDQIVSGQLGYEDILDLLEDIRSNIDAYVSKNTYAYLKKVGLAPLPKEYLAY